MLIISTYGVAMMQLCGTLATVLKGDK
jgi:hypothetical protein